MSELKANYEILCKSYEINGRSMPANIQDVKNLSQRFESLTTLQQNYVQTIRDCRSTMIEKMEEEGLSPEKMKEFEVKF